VLPVIFSPSAFANTSTIYLTSASSTVQYGASFVVNVNGYVDYSPSVPYFDPGSKRVYGSVVFPANLLQIASVSTASSPYNWNNNMATDNLAGKLAFDNQSQSGTYGKTINIMAITFQARAAGSATINFTSNTRYDVNIPQLYAGTIKITGGPGPSPTPSPTPAPTPTPTPSPTPGTTPTTPTLPGLSYLSPDALSAKLPVNDTNKDGSAEKKGFAVSDGEVSRGYDQSVVGWKTNEPSTNTFKYGVAEDKLDKTGEVTLRPDEGYQVRLAGLTPGKQYFFEVAAAASGDSSKTDRYTGTFTTKGFPVEIIFTQGGQPASEVNVKQGNYSYKTDKDGKLQLELPSGDQELAIETADGDKPVKLTVLAKALSAEGKAPETQHFKFDIPGAAATDESGGISWLTVMGVIIGLISAGGIFAFVVFWMRRRAQMSTSASYDADYGYTTTTAAVQQSAEPLPSYAGDKEPYPTMGEIPEPPKPYQPPSTAQESLKDDEGPDMWDARPLPEPSARVYAEPTAEQEMMPVNEQFDEATADSEIDTPEQTSDQPEENTDEVYENESSNQDEYSETSDNMPSDNNMEAEDYDQSGNEDEQPIGDPTQMDIQQDEQFDDETSEDDMANEESMESEDAEDTEDGIRIEHSK
jgi:hypothetical protein